MAARNDVLGGRSWGIIDEASHFETNRCVHFVGRVRYCPVARTQRRSSEISMVEPLRMDRAKQGFDKAVGSLDKAVGGFGKFARNSSKQLIEQNSDLEDVAVGTGGKLTTKKPDPYEEAIAQYNGAFASMNDKGLSLLCQRERSTDLIELVELLVNSVAHTPKSFETDFDEIDVHKTEFLEAEEFARKDLEAARKSAAGAGAGFTCGGRSIRKGTSSTSWSSPTETRRRRNASSAS